MKKNNVGQSIMKKKTPVKESTGDSLTTESLEEDLSDIPKTRLQTRKKQNRSEIIQPADIPGLFMIDRNPNTSEPAAASSSNDLRTFPQKSSDFSTKNSKK
jgi:hypothetical protein